jgi:hypothetical protein
MDLERREASPVEIGVLLMDGVCTPSAQEQDALSELAIHLGVELERIQTELLYLRAFAVDFAMALALGESPAKEAVTAHYYSHWDLVAREAGEAVLEDLQARLQVYAQAVDDLSPNPAGLRGQVGQVFADHCQAGEQSPDLALLGGAMFAALFEEIADLFNTVDIVLYEEP